MTKNSLFFLGFSFVLAVPSAPVLSQTPEKPTVYRVHRGDSLWRISDKTWGEGKKWPHLYKANQEAIHDPNLIFPGQELMVPEGVATILTTDHEASASSTTRTRLGSEKSGVPSTNSEGTATSPAPEAEGQEGTGSGSKWVLWVLGLLALASGLFWFLQRRYGRAPAQRPEPLSSYRPPERSSAPPPTPSIPVSRPSPSVPDRPIQAASPAPAPTQPVTTPPSPSALPIAGSAADVYIQQGLFAEAAKVYRGILDRDPNNTEVAKKLMELEDRMRRQVAQEISQKELPLTVPTPVTPPVTPPSGVPSTTAGTSSPTTPSADPYLPPEAESIVKEEEKNRPSADGTTPK